MIKRTIAVMTLLAAGTALSLLAKEPKQPDICYDPTSVVTFTATVTGVKMIPAPDQLEGLHLQTVGQSDIYVAPAAFLRMLKTDFARGDEVQVIGSKVKVGNNDVILVREITNAHTTLILRDSSGEPVWKDWATQLTTEVRRPTPSR